MLGSVPRRGLLAGAAGAAVLAGSQVLSGPATAAPNGQGRKVRTGLEMLIASGYATLRGQKVGVLTNETGILRDQSHEVDVMHADGRVDLVAVFGPEHGFRGVAQAGGSQGFFNDPHTGLPVYDTYLKSGQALADIITTSGVDTVMFDIQDIGARFYTYIWSMYDAMVASAMAGKRFVVLDRPNAISGRQALGPMMHAGYETFVGRKPIAQAHGMTVGELARLFNDQFVPADAGHPVDLTVIDMDGWTRDMYFEDTGLPWVMPSPNIPTPDSAVVYVGTGMFEGTAVSEGRGTTRPFELISAPYGDWRWRDALLSLDLPGVTFRENYVNPTFSKFVGQNIGGVEVYVTDRQVFDPIRTAVAMMVTLKQVYGDQFMWRSDNYIDKLSGSDYIRTSIDAGKTTDEVVAGWQAELTAFRALREKFLTYHDRGDN